MLRFFGRRVLLLAFTLAVASVLIFAITNVRRAMSPGSSSAPSPRRTPSRA